MRRGQGAKWRALASSELESVYRSRIQNRITGVAQAHPVAHIVAGQPGAGKSGLEDLKRRSLGGRDCVLVDVDRLRVLYPGYEDMALEDDMSVADFTHRSASTWAEMAIRDAISGHYNIVVSMTLGRPEVGIMAANAFRRSGYRVEVSYLAVHKAISGFGRVQRYLSGRDRDGFGRWVPDWVHDTACTGVVSTAATLEYGGLADSVAVYVRRSRDSSDQDEYEEVYRSEMVSDGSGKEWRSVVLPPFYRDRHRVCFEPCGHSQSEFGCRETECIAPECPGYWILAGRRELWTVGRRAALVSHMREARRRLAKNRSRAVGGTRVRPRAGRVLMRSWRASRSGLPIPMRTGFRASQVKST